MLATTIASGVTPVLIGWTLTTGGPLTADRIAAVVAIVTAVVGLVALLSAWRSIRQTTLTGAWGWSVAAVVCWSATEVAAGIQGSGSGVTWIGPARLAALALSFCPVVALLGAKRPQHQVWNLIVVSLFGIVALPAAETFFLHPGQKLALGEARRWFLWILVLLGPISFVPTRFWLASLLVAAGQAVALGPHLAMMGRTLASQAELVGLVLGVLGIVVARLTRSGRVTTGLDRVWLDFRDHFGLLWALRVQERVNATAEQGGWGVELGWSGFSVRQEVAEAGSIDEKAEQELRGTLTSLVRRFVSREWIAERLKAPRA